MPSRWSITLEAALWLILLCEGIAHLGYGDWFLKRMPPPKEGQLLPTWDRAGYRVLGFFTVVVSGIMLYGVFLRWT